ncbi:Fic family protein [Lactobacillus sp. ESL0684]|uniref:Fic family protein n=1 Tax=Lactobacillus sp. ESL0684 TaxID=2983213 RepID=UPI0023F8006D|nr:Fic family protein [Lactobacillus sp. ESL0684]WEV44498.1 Fic family protein [Lactobacillus sp. ESL0684]
MEVYPYGSNKRPYALPFEIPEKMQQLQNWSNQARISLHPVQYATDLHQKFVTIHPFRDGNGRTARLLMNLVLTENGYPVINVNPSKNARDKYMQALASAESPENNSQPFRDLIADYVEKELNNRIDILQLNEKYTKEAEESFKESKINWDKLEQDARAKLKAQKSTSNLKAKD